MSLVWERRTLIWTFGHQFLSSTLNIRLKYDLSRVGEICPLPKDYLKFLSVTDFWHLEIFLGNAGFGAVGVWLAVHVTQTIVPGVGFWCFRSKGDHFSRFFVSRFYGGFTPKTGFSSKKRPLSLLVGRGRSLPAGRDFGPGDTTLGRPSGNLGLTP